MTAPAEGERVRLTVAEGLERHLLGGLLAATIATHLLVSRNGLLPVQQPTTFALEFWKWIALAYAAVALGGFAVLWLPFRLLHRDRLSRAVLFAECAAFATLVAVFNTQAVRHALRPPGEPPATWAALASVLAAAAGLALVAAPWPRTAWPLRLVTAIALGTAAFAFRPMVPPPSAPQAQRRAPPTAPLVVVGLDGADWAYLEPLIARGDLPNLRKLRDGGAWGALETIRPTLSPAIWTTAVTGRIPQRHGIRGFTTTRIGSIDQTLPPLRPLRGLLFDSILERLRARGHLRERPVGSTARRAAAYWNVATAYGMPVDVVEWWATAPAEQVLGHVVSDRTYFEELSSRGRKALPAGLVHPPELGREVAALIVLPDQVTLADARRFVDVTPGGFEAMRVQHPSPLTGIAHELTYFISTFESTRKIALHVMARSRRRFGRPADLFVLFRIIDKTSHTALLFSDLVDDHVEARPEDLARFGGVVTGAYRAADSALGEILAAAGDANVVVLSDHGFRLEGEGAARGYNHGGGPPGILIGHGPAFAKGRVEGVTMYDVFPLLAYLKALPIADDLPGTLPLAMLDPGLIAERPAERTASYGVEIRRATDRGSSDADAEMLERLRALGYLQ